MKKLYAVSFDVLEGGCLGPAPWSRYPDGVELVEVPRIQCTERGASVHLVVRCEPEIGKQMGWVPFDKADDAGAKPHG